MGAISLALATWLERIFGTAGLVAQLATGLVPVAAGATLYLALTHALRVGEADVLVTLVTRQRRQS